MELAPSLVNFSDWFLSGNWRLRMRPRHFTSFSVIVFLAKPASYTALGLVGCCGRVESCRLYPARFPLPMRAAQLLVSLLRLGWLTDRNSSAIIVPSHALWLIFPFLFENFSKVFTTDFLMMPLSLLQKRPQFQTNYTSWTVVNVGRFCVLGYDGGFLFDTTSSFGANR